MCSVQHPPGAALQEDRGEGIQRREQGGRVSQEGIDSVTACDDDVCKLQGMDADEDILHYYSLAKAQQVNGTGCDRVSL
ncbi:hypothetical protein EJB05_56178, partial [Eragrostis curvula]